MQIAEETNRGVGENADHLADFIMFAQRSFLLDLSKELNQGNLSYAQFFLLGYLANEDFLTMTDISKNICSLMGLISIKPCWLKTDSNLFPDGNSN